MKQDLTPEVRGRQRSDERDDESPCGRQRLGRIELGLMERVSSLVDSAQQLSQARFRGCYDPAALAQRVGSGLESGPDAHGS